MTNLTDDIKKQQAEIALMKSRIEQLAKSFDYIPLPIFEKCIGVTVVLLFLLLMF